jgi:hypothetical protein
MFTQKIRTQNLQLWNFNYYLVFPFDIVNYFRFQNSEIQFPKLELKLFIVLELLFCLFFIDFSAISGRHPLAVYELPLAAGETDAHAIGYMPSGRMILL